MALNSIAAVRFKFLFEYRCTDGWDLQVVLCLSEHINCTINWEPFSVTLVTDAVRQQVRPLIKRTVKDDQYIIIQTNRQRWPIYNKSWLWRGGNTCTFAVAWIFSFTLIRYAIFTFVTGFFVTFSLQVFIVVNFRLFDVTLYVHDVALYANFACVRQVKFCLGGNWCHLLVTLKCVGCFSVNLEYKILH